MLMLVKINSFLGKKIYILSIRRCIEKYKKDLDGGGGGMINQGLTMYIMCQPTKIYIYVPGGH